jgi:hypothetical protein
MVSFSTADYADDADLTLLLMLPIKSKFPIKKIFLSVSSVSSGSGQARSHSLAGGNPAW